jgi:hypothetical protein
MAIGMWRTRCRPISDIRELEYLATKLTVLAKRDIDYPVPELNLGQFMMM